MATRNFAVLVAREVARHLLADARRAKSMGRYAAVRHYVQQARHQMHRALVAGEFGTVSDFIAGR